MWYEPNVLFNSGALTSVGRFGDRRAGLAFHDYCLTTPVTGTSAACEEADNRVFSNAVSHVAASGDALMETEFGATNNVGYLEGMVAREDFPGAVVNGRTAGRGRSHHYRTGHQASDRDRPRKAAGRRQPRASDPRALVEPYPQIVAGTPRSWAFDRSSHTFTLSYATARASGSARFAAGSVTEIATPALVTMAVTPRTSAAARSSPAAELRFSASPRVRTPTRSP